MATPTKNISFTLLPLELLTDCILVLLPIKDLLSLSCTCRNIHSAIHGTELLWKRKIKADYRFPIESTGRKTGFKRLYQKLKNPQVWVWGQNLNDRLGLDVKEHENLLVPTLSNYTAVPTPLRLSKVESLGIVDLQAGGWSFHALDVDGNVWYWGTLDGMLHGWNPQTHRFSPNRSQAEPAMLNVTHLPKFKAISCGRSHACGISDEGQIYEWHSWSRVAKLTCVPWEAAPGVQRIAEICASWDFTALLSQDGVVYFWKEPSVREVKEALDSQFRISEGNSLDTVYDLDSRERIIRCPDLPDDENHGTHGKDRISKIACGEDFIICLTASGKIYKLDVSSFPLTEQVDGRRVERQSEEVGQMMYRESLTQALCRGQRAWQYLPKFCESNELKQGLSNSLPLESLSEGVQPKITHISAQYRTFVAYSVETPSEIQSNKNQNSFVFFGKKETNPDDMPEIIPSLQQKGVIQVTLGDYHFVALLSNGNILSWGNYSEGALGLGLSSNPHRKLVPLSPSDSSIPDESNPQYEMGIQVPTLVQSFSGTDYRLSDRVTSSNSNTVKAPSRYVFSVTAAGWHTGCLAFSLHDDQDLDYGLAVLEKEAELSRGNRRAQRQHVEHQHVTLPFIPRLPFPNFRIGFPGRFMRGGAREVLRNRQEFDDAQNELSESDSQTE